MFRKKQSWFVPVLKTMVMLSIMYRFARSFMKTAEKMNNPKPDLKNIPQHTKKKRKRKA